MKLVTIGFSHYNEKARWALDRMGVEYTEEAHAPLGHFLAIKLAGGKKTLPVLVTDDGVFDDSTDILKYVDPFGPEEARLYPEDPGARREVEDLETLFDEKLGGEVRRWVYSWIIDEVPLLKSIFEGSMTKGERALRRVIVPAARLGIKRGMKITPKLRESRMEKIRAIYDSVEKRLEAGKYLVGDRFSAADLTLAALSVPALLPPENGWPSPPLSEFPEGMQKQIADLRATKVGAHAMRMYREERARRFKAKT
ncbi:MAG: glutathione S-transferase family protein [Polyangiaceae bacterium]